MSTLEMLLKRDHHEEVTKCGTTNVDIKNSQGNDFERKKKKSDGCCGSLNPTTKGQVYICGHATHALDGVWKNQIWRFITTTVTQLCEGTDVSFGALDWQ